MSVFVDEIIADIRKNPTHWIKHKNSGLSKDNIKLECFGNGHKLMWGWSTSICEVLIDDKICQTTWRDKYQLEETFKWWMQHASLEMLQAKK
jgi:hypothetical protein